MLRETNYLVETWSIGIFKQIKWYISDTENVVINEIKFFCLLMSLALCIYYRGDNYQHIDAMFFKVK